MARAVLPKRSSPMNNRKIEGTGMTMNKLPHAAEGTVHASKTIEDGVLASSLITAPAWGPWLSEVNNVLTTMSLLIGLAIGCHRLWRIYKSSVHSEKKTKANNE